MPLSIGSPATRLRWVLSDALAVTTRNLLHVPRMPDRIIGVVVQPIMFGLLLPLVLGSAIKLPGAGGYPEYLVAGLVVQSTAFAAVSAAVGIAGDLRQGIVDRFHLLPMVRSAVLIGRLCAELVQALIGVGIIVLCGLAVGWRIRGGALHALGALGVLLAFAFTMKWVGILTGLLGRAPEAATALSFVWIFPFILL
jgi:ABC-2 type transport system permease protein